MLWQHQFLDNWVCGCLFPTQGAIELGGGASNWGAKRALSGEIDRKLHIATHGRMWYTCVCVGTYVPYVHNPGVHERF